MVLAKENKGRTCGSSESENKRKQKERQVLRHC